MPRPPVLVAALLATGLSCKPEPDPEPRPNPLLDVAETSTRPMHGLFAPAYVLRTEGNVPHVYAANRYDAARVLGFVQAQDRFFEIDMARRLALGEVSSLLGDAALATDLESRGTGMTAVAENILGGMSSEQGAICDSYAAGINDYITAVADSELPPPSEYEIASVLLGASHPSELMDPFSRRDVAGALATILYNLGYETGDVGRADGFAQLDTHFEGVALGQNRTEGLREDIWGHIEPVFPVASSDGFGLDTIEEDDGDAKAATSKKTPRTMLARLRTHLDRLERRFGHDHDGGWGSNAWAVNGAFTVDGRALMAGDGHLPLTIPPLFWQAGVDTSVLGRGEIHQMGLFLPGLPYMAVGTNGHVAWSQTQLMGDVTDWYRDEIVLDAAGLPLQNVTADGAHELIATEELVDVADVPLLDSVGRTETFTRWTTDDGRWITSIEGRAYADGDTLGEGESVVRMLGDLIVPGDEDGDGVVTAVSFDWTGLDATTLLYAIDGFGSARSVEEFREETKHLVFYSQNVVVADATGSVLYTGYQGVPCRGYLPRNDDGTWQDGADPGLLLDGTLYQGFTIPVDGAHNVDETQTDPYQCVVPWSEYPTALDPARGYVLTANNDPGGMSFDNSLTNDPYYIGGPWLEGYRADTIQTELVADTSTKTASIATMQELQANTVSRVGEMFAPELLATIADARAASMGGADPDTADGRLAALYEADAAAWDEVENRIEAWASAGYPTPSGVETFYASVEEGDEDAAVATMIFNTWFGRYVSTVLDDEQFPSGTFFPSGATGRLRTLKSLLEGRGDDNPNELASWTPTTDESAFFDVLGTTDVESSGECGGIALESALAFLRSEPVETGVGGFGTGDMDAWIWGYRHWVRFESILAEFLGDDPTYEPLVEPFAITPDLLPLADDLPSDDPRKGMPGFPRPGDNLAVDAGNPGFSGSSFDYGSGPVFRMVVALGPEGPEGYNILPGGQSGLTDSANFADQAALWLGNEAWPMRFHAEDVIANATARETFTPDGNPLIDD